ncbi:hypothetical protein Scep_014208 [Stephania cephalantha]|uniref:Uncharacterized protein n=1 Tax=Stephania cephalantha TaxID=152367 RepID=A0AAP0NZ68_9MAGN
MVVIQPACLFAEKELADSSSGEIGGWCGRRTSRDGATPGRTTSNDNSDEALVFNGVHSRRKERKRRKKMRRNRGSLS